MEGEGAPLLSFCGVAPSPFLARLAALAKLESPLPGRGEG